MVVSVSTSRRLCVTALSAAFLAMSAASVVGQQSVGGSTIAGASQQRITAAADKVVADNVTTLAGRDLIVYTGNVVLSRGENKITSESATFNVNTQRWTFVRAYGVFVVQGGAPLYFYGETVEQTDSNTYRLTNGVFTSSTQSTPSWQLTSASIVFSLR